MLAVGCTRKGAIAPLLCSQARCANALHSPAAFVQGGLWAADRRQVPSITAHGAADMPVQHPRLPKRGGAFADVRRQCSAAVEAGKERRSPRPRGAAGSFL